MEKFILFDEQRAEIYLWMSSIFAAELTSENIEYYTSTEMDEFFNDLAKTPELKKPIVRFQKIIKTLKNRNDAQLELAADFCSLFLMSQSHGALPYASIYVNDNDLLNGKPAQEMREIMTDHGIVQCPEFNEPADHLAVQLNFMGDLIVKANKQKTDDNREAIMFAQQNLLESRILNWLPSFVQACLKFDKFGFYAAVASLLITFCQLDLKYIRGE